MAARVSQATTEAVIAPNPALRVSQLAVEVLSTYNVNTSNARVTQVTTEAVIAPVPVLRISQLAVEVLSEYNVNTSNARVTQSSTEAVVAPDPALRVSQLAVEVLVTDNPGEPSGGIDVGGDAPGGSARVTQVTTEAVVAPDPVLRISQLAVEVLSTYNVNTSNARVTQVTTEAVIAPVPVLRISQLAVEVLSTYNVNTSNARVTQVTTEAVVAPVPVLRVSQLAIEILVIDDGSLGISLNNGIASSEAFGTALLDLGVDIIGTGISSAGAFGTLIIVQTIQPTGIASAGAFGTASLDPAVDIIATGIASAEAFGTPYLYFLLIAPTGIASAEAFGTLQVNQKIEPTGIASAEAFGSLTIVQTIQPTGIASAEAFGDTVVIHTIHPTGIASTEAFGTALLDPAVDIICTGISSAEVFGDTVVIHTIHPTGIAGAEAFGTLITVQTIQPVGIYQGAFGTLEVHQSIQLTGIAGAEAFGTLTIVQTVQPTGIAGAEAFGDFTTLYSYDYTATGGLVLSGSADSIIELSYTATGGMEFSGIADSESQYEFSTEFTWDVQQIITLDLEVAWDVGDPRFYWYRVKGKCIDRNCPPFADGQSCSTYYTATILARTVGEVCERMNDPDRFNFKPWTIDTIQKFSRPAMRVDFDALADDDPSRECNQLVDVTPPVYRVPESCIALFIDEDFLIECQTEGIAEESYGVYTAVGGLTFGGSASSRMIAVGDIRLRGQAPTSYNPYYADLEFSGEAITGVSDFIVDMEFEWDVEDQDVFVYVPTGGLTISGGGNFTPTLQVGVDPVISSEDESGTFEIIEASEFVVDTSTITPECCEQTFPLVINLEASDLSRMNNFQHFLSRNGLTFNGQIKLIYNVSNETWQGNVYYKGFSNTGNTYETYNIVFEVGCSDVQNTLPNSTWKFSMRVINKNLTTGFDGVTRLFLVLNTSVFCNPLKLGTKLSINTKTKSVSLSNVSTILSDDLNLFKNKSWISDPTLVFNLSLPFGEDAETGTLGDLMVPAS